MKYLEDSRLTQLTFDLTGAFLNTRGSGTPSGGGLVNNANTANNVRSKNNKRGKNKNKQQQQQQQHQTANGKNKTSSYYTTYTPAGYSTYNENGSSSSSGSSSRAIHGRVEAYTTKRAGSDKKTAFEVGERYATEMERLNEAVETLRRRKNPEIIDLVDASDGDDDHDHDHDHDDDKGLIKKEDRPEEKAAVERRRPRSRSVDGVTFATASPRLVFDRTANSSAVMREEPTLMPLEEGAVAVSSSSGGDEARLLLREAAGEKRHLPSGGILKPPFATRNKRSRATSFDVSTGPSTYAGASRLYRRSGLPGPGECNALPLSIVHPTVEEDRKTYPLIPQPSLYRSSIGSEQAAETDGCGGGGSPTMVPRRLVTDLILTLNASFPDYDFGDAQVSDFRTLSIPEAMRRVNERLGEFAATTDAGRDFLPRFWGSVEDVLYGDLSDCEVYSYAPQEGTGTGEDDPLEFLTRSMVGVGDDDDNGECGSDGAASGGGDGGDVGKETGDFVFSPADGGRIISDDLDASVACNLPNQVSPSSGGDRPPHLTIWSMNYFFVSRNKKRIVLFACVQTMRTPQGNADDEEGDGYYCEYGENNLVFDEARREKEDGEYYGDALYPLSARTSDTVFGTSAGEGIDKMSEMLTSPSVDESVGVMVEDTDFEEEVDVEVVDGDEGHFHNDFDTGTLSAPSQVA